jgi:GNAT superfamily N-acetyltransferase
VWEPSEMIIRDAVEADDTIVGELLVQAYLTQFAKKLPDVSYSAERLADLRNQSARRASASVLVAEIDGRIVGTVTLYPAGASGSEAWIAGAADLRLLAIHPEFQGRDLSGKLLDAAEALARKWGASAICLHTRQGASGVARLYHSRGYVRDETGDLDHRPSLYLEAHALRL